MDDDGYIKFQVVETKISMVIFTTNSVSVLGIEGIKIPK